MGWVTITEADLLTRLTATEITAIKTTELAAGQPDPIPPTITAVVKEIRGRLRNITKLEADETLPDNLVGAACNIIRMKLTTRFPGVTYATADRLQEYIDANLAILALGPIVPEAPANPESLVTDTNGTPLMTARTNHLTYDLQEGV